MGFCSCLCQNVYVMLNKYFKLFLKFVLPGDTGDSADQVNSQLKDEQLVFHPD